MTWDNSITVIVIGLKVTVLATFLIVAALHLIRGNLKKQVDAGFHFEIWPMTISKHGVLSMAPSCRGGVILSIA